MSNMNLFTWLRDGVRQSVLLGVSDAVEQLGTPAATEDLHPSVVGFLQMDRGGEDTPRISGGSASPRSRTKKRLGKSLKEMGTEEKS